MDGQHIVINLTKQETNIVQLPLFGDNADTSIVCIITLYKNCANLVYGFNRLTGVADPVLFYFCVSGHFQVSKNCIEDISYIN